MPVSRVDVFYLYDDTKLTIAPASRRAAKENVLVLVVRVVLLDLS